MVDSKIVEVLFIHHNDPNCRRYTGEFNFSKKSS